MKGIFSAATFVALLSALAAAAPLKHAARSANGPLVYTKGADFIHVTSEANPQTDQAPIYGTQTALIARTNGQDEFASYVSFAIPALSNIAGASASSTCNIVIKYPAQSQGSQITQLFSLGSEFTESQTLTFNQHPYHNQYYGEYNVLVGQESTPVDVFTVPCKFGDNMQFVMRPQNDNDYITWVQSNSANVGAFVEIRN
jgi:Ubiquitin 3 binding protein But2 C-terminal domain